jgi:hypothetical protein
MKIIRDDDSVLEALAPLNSRFKLQNRLDHYVEKMNFVCDLVDQVETLPR